MFKRGKKAGVKWGEEAWLGVDNQYYIIIRRGFRMVMNITSSGGIDSIV